jgi:putative heme degradation protein
MLWLSLWNKYFKVSHRSASWTLNTITHAQDAGARSARVAVAAFCCSARHELVEDLQHEEKVGSAAQQQQQQPAVVARARDEPDVLDEVRCCRCVG